MFHVLARRSVIGFLCLWFDLRWALIVCCGAVPTDSTYPPIDIRSPEAVICSEITSSSTEKHPWCEIKWNPDKDSAMIRNLRFVIRCLKSCTFGSGLLIIEFMLLDSSFRTTLLSYSNGCFSEWLRRSSTKFNNRAQSVVCPQCRAVVLSVGRNHFLHNIEEVAFSAIFFTFISILLSH
ncbi:hypothetical protein BHM03_00041692 [Ensete ventricosum]|nr:hypothetical protein BHM03_00041692 [Ensete ventricosum]